jgi:putative ABC transport system permease protein
MGNLVMDMKVALRTIRRSRFVSVLAIIAFALGIGVTTAVFSIFNAVLLQPLPYPDPDELVSVYDTQPACTTCPASFPKYHDWKERNHVFSTIGGSTPQGLVMTGSGDPVRVSGMATTASLKDVFGVEPQLGRWYSEDEDQPDRPKVVVLSHDFWAGRLGRTPAILGEKLTFNGQPYEVIGVMPAGFSHRRADVFVPLQRKLDPATRGSHFLATYARLKKDVTLDQATTEMRALGKTLAEEFKHNHGIDVRSYREVVIGSIRPPLRILLGAVFLVLIIACANVANLLLASGLARRRELAIRLALGAGQKDLARQLTAESLCLSLIGGALGLLVARWVLETFIGMAGTQLPRANTIAIDRGVLLFTTAISIGVGIFCGLWPLILIRTKELAAVVREGDSRTGSAASHTFGSGLVVGEIAVAFTLLVGAGLLVKNFLLLLGRDAGVHTDRVVTFDISLSGDRYQAPEQALPFYRELQSRLSSLPEVETIGFTSHLPMYNFGFNGEFQIEGSTPWKPNEAPLVEYRWMFGNYLNTLGIPLLKGRNLDARDGKNSRAVLVNHAMAEKFWPGQEPLGKRFGQGNDTKKWYEVVGVVGDVRSFGLASASPFEFYQTIEQSMFNPMTVVVRTRNKNPASIIPTVRQIVTSMDSNLPITAVQTMEQVVAQSVGQPRLISALTTLFGSLAGLLAMVGVYGVMAYNVRRQRKDFGIRLALGADDGRVKKLVVGRGLALAVAGVLLGLAGAWTLTRVLTTMLNDVKPTDPSIFAGTAALVLLVAALACYLPARAAARVDPLIVLRDS